MANDNVVRTIHSAFSRNTFKDAESNAEQEKAPRNQGQVQNTHQKDPGTPVHNGSTSELISEYPAGNYYLVTSTGGTVRLYRVKTGRLDLGRTAIGEIGEIGETMKSLGPVMNGDSASGARAMNERNRQLWQRGRK